MMIKDVEELSMSEAVDKLTKAGHKIVYVPKVALPSFELKEVDNDLTAIPTEVLYDIYDGLRMLNLE